MVRRGVQGGQVSRYASIEPPRPPSQFLVFQSSDLEPRNSRSHDSRRGELCGPPIQPEAHGSEGGLVKWWRIVPICRERLLPIAVPAQTDRHQRAVTPQAVSLSPSSTADWNISSTRSGSIGP